MEKIIKVMENVMAALNTWGTEYDVNTCGFNSRKSKESILRNEPNIVDFKGFDGGKTFKTKFEKFANKPHYSKVIGNCWADDGEFVLIQFFRYYEMDEEDWDNYAAWCGVEDPAEAQAMYGDPEVSRIYMNIRVKKGNTRM